MIFNNNSQNNPQQFHSIIAIGNPIIDIVANINKETINKFGLKWGETVFTNQINKPFFQEIQKESEVTFIPGGAIQNTLRIMAWCISQDPNTSINDYKAFHNIKIELIPTENFKVGDIFINFIDE